MPLRWQKIHLWLADLKVSLSNSSQKLIYLVGRGLIICSHYWSISIILQKLNIQILENWELLSEYMYYWYYWLNKPCILLFWFDCVMCALHISYYADIFHLHFCSLPKSLRLVMCRGMSRINTLPTSLEKCMNRNYKVEA